ncbi:unnamed protein product [Bursaphelenchus xylophilus]|uniref:(pine wood nematode) hypothetical protein n=1 Tax=Bursaphelenchus xylophilus TaxID=6326 RepID=A0A1I7RYM0_BURXY|nr:unnamed protein product [Bursaphelenchus xylophilus]CAG9092535.1 unnamed protein product [Bursaphelenchus xylophilus]
MKVLFLALAVLATAQAAVLDRETALHLEELRLELISALEKNSFAQQNPLLENVEIQKLGKFLCKPCQALFELIKVELQNAKKIEKAILLPTIHRYCHEKLGKIEQLEHLCANLADEALARLADWIQEESNKIEPDRVCVFLHAC